MSTETIIVHYEMEFTALRQGRTACRATVYPDNHVAVQWLHRDTNAWRDDGETIDDGETYVIPRAELAAMFRVMSHPSRAPVIDDAGHLVYGIAPADAPPKQEGEG